MPMDPSMENSNALKAKELQAFPEQDHAAHIGTHRAFMSSTLVRTSVLAMASLQSHISQHISFLARQLVMEENKQTLEELAQQFGQQIPPEIMQQLQNKIEAEIADKQAELTENMVAEEQEYLEGQGQDPLVELKKQELLIKEQDNARKAAADQSDAQLNAAKLAQKTEIDQAKLEQNAKIAQARMNNQINLANIKKQ